MQHVYQRVPVTALAFLNENVVLAGEGFRLTAYGVGNQCRLHDVPVFKRQAIHGIIVLVKSQTVLVWGGAFIREIKFTSSKEAGQREITLGPLLSTADWILDVAFAPNNAPDDYLAAAVTAHNALVFVSRQDATEDANIEPVVPGSNCILYSSHVKWLNATQSLVASGTAFGDIIVWSAYVHIEDGRRHVSSRVHYTFSAHEGSVFGVQLSNLSQVPNLERQVRMLASCSDDRTVRLWDISNFSQDKLAPGQNMRMTGFGKGETPEDDAPPLLAKTMAHTSRIWSVMFWESSVNERPRIVSFGEDVSTITWNIVGRKDPSNHLPFQLVQIRTDTVHTGKNIWSNAISMEQGHCITGGADGAIVARLGHFDTDNFPLTHRIEQNAENIFDKVRVYCFVKLDTLICTTDTGKIQRMDIDFNRHPTLCSISAPLPGLKGYSLATSANGIAFVAGHDGKVYACQAPYERTDVLSQVDRKVAGLFACGTADDHIHLLVTMVGATDAKLLSLRPTIDSDGPGERELRSLTLPAGFIVTSFASFKDILGVHCFLGSRGGDIAVYSTDNPNSKVALTSKTVQQQLHGREAVTSLTWLPDESPDEQISWIYSTGRDGKYAVHEARHLNDGNINLSLKHQLTLPIGPNVEGVDLSGPGRIRIHGFKGKRFVVYDVVRHLEVMSVECGGAHRNWAFEPSRGGGNFVWTKASQIFSFEQQHSPHLEINGGTHGREIKALAISPITKKKERQQMIATGAEDTDIKLWRREHGSLWCLHTLRKHNTGIQHIQWVDGANGSSDTSYLFSSGGFEEFFVWRVTPDVPRVHVGVVCESVHPRSGTSDLRIMAFDARQGVGGEDQSRSLTFSIFMAYSDSSTKLWHYQAGEEPSWTLSASGNYLTACLTQAQWLDSNDCGTSPSRMLTAATDGNVAVWHLNGQSLTWTHRRRVHQSSIHAMATHSLADASTVVVTGGDDNSIGITRVLNAEPEFAEPLPTLRIARAHAAAVTAIALRKRNASTFDIFAAGLDQRVKVWRVALEAKAQASDAPGLRVTLVRNVSSPVADVSSVGICELEDDGLGHETKQARTVQAPGNNETPQYENGETALQDLTDHESYARIVDDDDAECVTGVVVAGVGMTCWRLAEA